MNTPMNSHTFTRTAPPAWLLAFWKEIDDKTWGKGFDCFVPNAVANLGVSDWHGRGRPSARTLRTFVDKGFLAHHDVVEFWDGGVSQGVSWIRHDDDPTIRPRSPYGPR